MRLAFALALALSAALVGAARADSPEAEGRTLYEAGKQAFDRGDYQTAYQQFSRAYSVTRRPQLLFNMASALQKLERPSDAADALRAFLRQVPDDPDRSAIEERIRALDEHARTLELQERLHQAEQRDGAPPGTTTTTPLTLTPPTLTAPALTAAAPPPRRDSLVRKWWFWTSLTVAAGVVVTVIAVPIATHYFTEDPFVGTLGARKAN